MTLKQCWDRAYVKWATEDGRPRCEALTYKGTRCTRLGGIKKVSVITDYSDPNTRNWKREIQWRCYQHGG